jgi:hypothetical protein
MPPYFSADIFFTILTCGLGIQAYLSQKTRSQTMNLHRLRVSENQRFLVTDQGVPFFWLGDTAWELFHRLTIEDVECYLKSRKQKKFNLIQAVALAEFDGLYTPNVYGEKPLNDNDPSQPNEAYWLFVDRVIRKADHYGLYIGLLPTWGDKVTDLWGIGPVIFDENNAYLYGEWLGRRYKEQKNVVWILGGDRPVRYIGKKTNMQQDDSPIWSAMAAGIYEGTGSRVLITYHPSGGHSSSEYVHDKDWLGVNMMQSGHGGGHDVPVWEMIEKDYYLMPVKPTLDGEPNYEDHPVNPWPEWDPELGYYNDYDVRKQLYRSVFAGGCGVTYGHHSVWQMYSERYEAINHAKMYWREAISRPGASQVQYLRRLMESRPYLTRIPDQSLIKYPNLDRSKFNCATRDDHGRYALIYLPDAPQVTVDLGALAGGEINAWWFDPRNGRGILDGKYSGGVSQTFVAPHYGPDWVLVLDDVAAKFSNPGIEIDTFGVIE